MSAGNQVVLPVYEVELIPVDMALFSFVLSKDERYAFMDWLESLDICTGVMVNVDFDTF